MRKPVSEESVRKAIREYDRIQQKEFLNKYHFGKSRNYFLIVDGKEYDSKAILAAAYGYEYPGEGPLRYEDNLYGGAKDTARELKHLGFHVEYRPSEYARRRSPTER
jgi:hypothetical protein